jgi:hypothetical protein
MKELIERFYNSIRPDTPVAIPCREIIVTARIMDEIFAQIYGGEARTPLTPPNRDLGEEMFSSPRINTDFHG